MASSTKTGTTIWVVQQHDQFSMVESKEVPSTKVEAGQRGKSVFGPYATKADAESIIKAMEAKTLRGKREGK